MTLAVDWAVKPQHKHKRKKQQQQQQITLFISYHLDQHESYSQVKQGLLTFGFEIKVYDIRRTATFSWAY